MTMIYRDQIMDGLGTWEDPVPDIAEIGRRLAVVRAAGLPAYVALDAQLRVVGFSCPRPAPGPAAGSTSCCCNGRSATVPSSRPAATPDPFPGPRAPGPG
jgi:hypothetical protein